MSGPKLNFEGPVSAFKSAVPSCPFALAVSRKVPGSLLLFSDHHMSLPSLGNVGLVLSVPDFSKLLLFLLAALGTELTH